VTVDRGNISRHGYWTYVTLAGQLASPNLIEVPLGVHLRPPAALGDAPLKAEQAHEEAIEHLQRAVALGPDIYDAQYHLGLTLAQLGRWKEAEPHLGAAVKLEQLTLACSTLRGGQSCPPRNAGAALRGGQDCPPREDPLHSIVGCSKPRQRFGRSATGSCLRQSRRLSTGGGPIRATRPARAPTRTELSGTWNVYLKGFRWGRSGEGLPLERRGTRRVPTPPPSSQAQACCRCRPTRAVPLTCRSRRYCRLASQRRGGRRLRPGR